jgi:hypothetical protein
MIAHYIESVLEVFVVEARNRDVPVTLGDHVPQVLTQLYAAATMLKCRFPSLFPDPTELMIGQENLYTGYIDKQLRMAFYYA